MKLLLWLLIKRKTTLGRSRTNVLAGCTAPEDGVEDAHGDDNEDDDEVGEKVQDDREIFPVCKKTIRQFLFVVRAGNSNIVVFKLATQCTYRKFTSTINLSCNTSKMEKVVTSLCQK